jgi:hypothetical protein
MSSCESEYVALTAGVKEAVFLRELLAELGHMQSLPTPISVDNQSAVLLSRNPEFHSRTKHIALAFHYAREQQQAGVVDVVSCRTEDQEADFLTKALTPKVFLACRAKVGFNQLPT